jgi:hypothetical protein
LLRRLTRRAGRGDMTGPNSVPCSPVARAIS